MTGTVILGVIAGAYTVLNFILLGCIIWCACCYRKRKAQVRPLSPNNSSSLSHGYLGENGTRNLRISAQSEARRLKTISESTTATGSDRITVTSFKGSPFISRNPTSDSGVSVCEELENGSSDSGSQGDNSGGNVFGDSPTGSPKKLEEQDHPVPTSLDLSNFEKRRREAMLRRNRAQRTESTKRLLGSSISSEISDPIGEDIGSSMMSLPGAVSSDSTQMRVLTRHAGSRKRRTDSMRSLVTNMEEYERSCSTLPRSHRLPPLAPRPVSSQATTPLQTLSENTTLNTESVLNLSRIERPRPHPQTPETHSKSKDQSTQPASKTLSNLSLNLAEDIGLEDKFKSMV